MRLPVVWTIAGSDPSAGAGIQSDLKTFHNFEVQGCTILTAITAQNTQTVSDINYLSRELIQAQLDSLRHCPKPLAIKIGMLGSIDAVTVLCDYLPTYNGFTVLDPIMHSSTGQPLYRGNLHHYRESILHLFPLIDLITPNLPEAECLLQRLLRTDTDIEQGAHELLASGVGSVLIKGGHRDNELSQDYWTNGTDSFWLVSPRIQKQNCHGTGCAYSAAIASCIATGYDCKDALVIAKMFINRGIRFAHDNNESFFIHGSGFPEDQQDLPRLTTHPVRQAAPVFTPDAGFDKDLYPIVDSVEWLKRLLPLGIHTMQLRIKNKTGKELEDAIKTSIKLANEFQVKLYINDHWQYAIRYQAFGVHLGQDDLKQADIQAIHAAGLRLGISTHCYYEVARAHAYQPSYIACGPIFATTTKQMPFQPQGLAALARWRRTLRYPLIAIGGIDHDNLQQVLRTNVDGVALISAITAAAHPEQSAKELLQHVKTYGA